MCARLGQLHHLCEHALPACLPCCVLATVARRRRGLVRMMTSTTARALHTVCTCVCGFASARAGIGLVPALHACEIGARQLDACICQHVRICVRVLTRALYACVLAARVYSGLFMRVRCIASAHPALCACVWRARDSE